ncbi:MAG TPA: imidazolonepropionase, partial [Pyrinomonadaceae bacterium]
MALPGMTLAIVNCSQVVTLAGPARPRVGAEMGQLGLVAPGALLIKDGKIEKVATDGEVKKLLDADCEVVDAGGRVVLPGFVDAHTHPVFAGTRVDEFEQRIKGATYQEIAARGGGIQATVNRTRAATVDELVATGKRYAAWFLRGGTTTIEAKSGYGLSLEDELKLLRAIRRLDQETALRYVPTFLGAHSIPAEYRARRSEYVSLLIDEMLPQVAQQKLAEFCDVFCEENVFSADEAWRILSAARCHGLGLRIHADQLSLGGGAKLAAELAAITADHLEHTDATGIAALKAAGVQP